MDFLQSFRNAYSGLKEGTEKQINQIALFVTKIEFFLHFLAISFAPTACPYRRTLCKLMSKFCDQY